MFTARRNQCVHHVDVRFPFELPRLPLYFITPIVPFFLGGMALSMIFDMNRSGAGSLYFADLIGASIGAVSVTLLLQMVGGEVSLLLAAIAPLVASGLLSRRLRIAALVEAAIILALAVTNGSTGRFHVIPGTIKAMRRQMDENPGSHVAQSGWTVAAIVTLQSGVPMPVTQATRSIEGSSRAAAARCASGSPSALAIV